MAYWLLETDPAVCSIDDLERDGTTVWNSVTDPRALNHFRVMEPGDLAAIYHSGSEKQVVGISEVVSHPYSNPTLGDPTVVVVDVRFSSRLKCPIPLAAIRADRAFAALELVRVPRLPVMPVPTQLWRKLLAMSH